MPAMNSCRLVLAGALLGRSLGIYITEIHATTQLANSSSVSRIGHAASPSQDVIVVTKDHVATKLAAGKSSIDLQSGKDHIDQAVPVILGSGLFFAVAVLGSRFGVEKNALGPSGSMLVWSTFIAFLSTFGMQLFGVWKLLTDPGIRAVLGNPGFIDCLPIVFFLDVLAGVQGICMAQAFQHAAPFKMSFVVSVIMDGWNAAANPPIAAVFFQQQVRPTTAIGVLMVFLAMALVDGRESAQEASVESAQEDSVDAAAVKTSPALKTSKIKAYALALFAGMCTTANFLGLQVILRRNPPDVETGAWASALGMIGGFLSLIPLSIVLGYNWKDSVVCFKSDVHRLIPVIFAGLFLAPANYMRSTGLALGWNHTYAIPALGQGATVIWTVLLICVAYREIPNRRQVFGLCLLLAAMWVICMSSRPTSE
eukprot:TRINITY_DN19852_c0_g1_i1.p1 TRINITY_DN19852_c0_g1~~TRINITY_DN19852_c0_g1_i1.p1  ORF type:complete len:425 (-),score=61.37 TRINITY_DN19852_c0_g1_i1:68-1342(-)